MDFEDTTFPYPAVWLTDTSFLSYAKAEDFSGHLGANLETETRTHAYDDVVSGKAVNDGPKHISQLLRIAWEQSIGKRLAAYELANKQFCFYFPGDLVKDDFVDFTMSDGQKRWRGIVGFKTIGRERKRYWHYGISARPIIRPETLFVVKGHVVFSDDRLTLWSNKDAMAKARRNQCRNWWNDDWRDRMLATMAFLADGQGNVQFTVGKDVAFTLSRFPILFESPVSYAQPEHVEKPDVDDYSFDDDEDEPELVEALPEAEVK